jgi:hypothetical protein
MYLLALAVETVGALRRDGAESSSLHFRNLTRKKDLCQQGASHLFYIVSN